MQTNFMTLFRRRIAETVAWCSLQPFVANGCSGDDLRYVWKCEIAPILQEDPLALKAVSILRTPSLEPTNFYLDLTTLERRRGAVSALAEERASLLTKVGKVPHEHGSDVKNGRFLLYDADASDASGGALVASAGFFDWDDAPPWDTWIAMFALGRKSTSGTRWQSFILSWVPPRLIDVVNAGIAACPMKDCISWASDVKAPLGHIFREAGLI